MIDAITDTGPLIHLSEMNKQKILKLIFNKLYTTKLIENEIIKYNISISNIPYHIVGCFARCAKCIALTALAESKKTYLTGFKVLFSRDKGF